MSSSFTQLNYISVYKREAKGMTKEKFTEILNQCGFDESICHEEPFEIEVLQTDIQYPGFAVHFKSTLDTDKLVKLKILSGYDLKTIDTLQASHGEVILVFSRGYKKGAIKRIVTGEILGDIR